MPHSKTPARLEVIFANSTDKQGFAIRKIIKSLFYNSSHSNLELSRITEFSTPTVSALLDNLKDHKIVEVRGQGNSNGGRKPVQYGLNQEFGYILAVFVDQYYTRLAILNLQCEHVVEPQTIPLKLSNDPEVTRAFCTMIQEYIRDSKVAESAILGVGIGMPGMIDIPKGLNHTYFCDAENGIRGYLTKELGLPVFIENDSNVLALGEHKFGFAKGKRNALVVNASWGVGLGMILNGELFHGHAGFAGEFSHIPMNDNGILCSCGKQGCLETEASAIALARLAREGISEGKLSSLSNLKNEQLEKLEADLVIEAANHGDPYSVQILSQIGYNLGKGLAVLMHILNPELIVISGRLARANHYIMTPIEQGLNKYSIPRLRSSTRVIISDLSQRAGLMGCASLVIENLFPQQKEKFAIMINN